MRHLILVFFIVFSSPALALSVEAPVKTLETMECNSCHRLSADASYESRKAPDLFYAGNKFQESWLMDFLQYPHPIRHAGYILDEGFLKGQPVTALHPALSEPNAKQATEALAQLKMKDFKEGVLKNTEMSKGERFKMKVLFERDYGCIACHQTVNLANQPRGGISGPSMLDAGDRLKPDWVYHWLKTPKKFEPKGRMPVFDLNEEELKGLAKYVLWHHQKKDK